MSGKRGRGRPHLTFENTVSKILEEGHVISMRTLRRTCEEVSDTGRGERKLRPLLTSRGRSVSHSVLSEHAGIQREATLA